MTRHDDIVRMSELRTKISELLMEYNKLSTSTQFGSRIALLEGSFEVEFGEEIEADERKAEEEPWYSSPSC